MNDLVKRLLPYLARYKKQLGLGMAALVLGKTAGVFMPQVLRMTVDDLTVSITTQKLLFYAGLVVGISAVEGFFRFWMRRLLIGVSRYVEYDLRGDFFAHLQHMSPSFFHRWRTGDLMSRAANDITAVRMVLGPGIMYPAETAIITIGCLVFMVSISFELTLVALAVDAACVLCGQEIRCLDPQEIRGDSSKDERHLGAGTRKSLRYAGRESLYPGGARAGKVRRGEPQVPPMQYRSL